MKKLKLLINVLVPLWGVTCIASVAMSEIAMIGCILNTLHVVMVVSLYVWFLITEDPIIKDSEQ